MHSVVKILYMSSMLRVVLVLALCGVSSDFSNR